jgi:hypothetical protein
MLQLLVTANVVPRSPIPVTLMFEAMRFSETSVLTRTTRRKIPEDRIRHSNRRGNLKSYVLSFSSECSAPHVIYHIKVQKNKQIPWPLVRERTIPTERPPLVDEI